MFSIVTHRRLKQHAMDTDSTIISIIASAVTEYLEKHGTDRAQLMLTMQKDDQNW